MKESKEKDLYLLEDEKIINELKESGALTEGTSSPWQTKQLQIVQIKALLRSRKSARDNEISNDRYSNIILIFTGVQVILGLPQLVNPWLGSTGKWFSIFVAVLVIIILWFFNRKISN